MSRNIGGYLVELLVANDIDTVFGIPGVHNLELYRGLTSANIRHVLVRTSRRGIRGRWIRALERTARAAFVISGPGFTNIMTAVAQAYSDSVPLWWWQPRRFAPLHQAMGSAARALRPSRACRRRVRIARLGAQCRGCAANTCGCAWPHSAPDARDRAYLEIPLDVLAETTTLEAQRFEDNSLMPQASPDQIGAAVRLLKPGRAAAHHCGRRRAPGRRGAAPSGRDSGLPLVTTAAGKGLLPESHPSNFGTSLPYPPIQRLIADADCGACRGH